MGEMVRGDGMEIEYAHLKIRPEPFHNGGGVPRFLFTTR